MLNIKDVHEEQRVGCLTQQMRSFIVAQDEVGNLPEVSLAIERSYLAMDICWAFCGPCCSFLAEDSFWKFLT